MEASAIVGASAALRKELSATEVQAMTMAMISQAPCPAVEAPQGKPCPAHSRGACNQAPCQGSVKTAVSRRRVLLAMTGLPFLMVALPGKAQERPILFGVVPQQGTSRLEREWGPLVRYLRERLDRPLQLLVAKDIPTFEARCAEGLYDIAYMNPHHYVTLSQTVGYSALARARDQGLRGLVVVAEQSPFRTLQDLNGQTVAFPSPNAFAASLLVRAELARQGVVITPAYVSDHESVYRTVAGGLYAAGGGVSRTLETSEKTLRQSLRVLWRTPPHTSHALAIHPRMEAALRAALVPALVGMVNDPLGQNILKNLNIPGWQLAADADWDDVRALRLSPPSSP
ncbi:MAG: phosphate/phosphite/phosphonate ABC transporter substrate-binding protein [Magnetococcus sp. WYHC-3]